MDLEEIINIIVAVVAVIPLCFYNNQMRMLTTTAAVNYF